MINKFEGTAAALVTPFNSEEEIDYLSLKKLLDHTSPYLDFYVVNGTTAESAVLSLKEQIQYLDFVKNYNKNKKPIVFGIGGNSTRGVVENIKQLNSDGIDALLSVSPYYNKPTQEGIYRHFMKIADASPVPVILYNVPTRTASNMTAPTTLRLATHENIIGIKEASGDLVQCIEIAKYKPNDFLLLSGDDLLTIPMISIGACGVISVIANALPKEFSQSVSLALQGDYHQAKEMLFYYYELNKLLFDEGNPAGVKAVLEILNVMNSSVRLPLIKASKSLKLLIKDQLLK